MADFLDLKAYLQDVLSKLSEEDQFELECSLNLLKFLADNANMMEPPIVLIVRRFLKDKLQEDVLSKDKQC